VNKIKNLFKIERKFDERQLLLENKIGKRMLYIILALIMLDSHLAMRDIEWASNRGFSNIIIILIGVAVMSVEATIKEVFFEYKWSKWLIFILYPATIILLIIAMISNLNCPVHDCYIGFISDGALTRAGSLLVMIILFTIILAAPLVKFMRDKLKKQSPEEADS